MTRTTLTQKIASLLAAAALFIPFALATASQAAQIVA